MGGCLVPYPPMAPMQPAHSVGRRPCTTAAALYRSRGCPTGLVDAKARLARDYLLARF